MEETLNSMASVLKHIAMRELDRMRKEKHKARNEQERAAIQEEIDAFWISILRMVDVKKRAHARIMHQQAEKVGGTD